MFLNHASQNYESGQARLKFIFSQISEQPIPAKRNSIFYKSTATYQLYNSKLSTIHNMMVEIASKRELFRSQIRSKQVSSVLSSLRARILKQERTHILATLAENIEQRQQIFKQQLMLIVGWCKEGDSLAMAYVGNFIIDGILSVQQIQEQNSLCNTHCFGLDSWIGEKEETLWLLHIFYQKTIFDSKQLLYLIQQISSKIVKMHKSLGLSSLTPQHFVHKHGLCLLRLILRQHSAAGELLLDSEHSEFTVKLLRILYLIIVSGPCSKVMNTVLSILNCLCQAQVKQRENSVIHQITQDKFKQIIRVGIKRVQTSARCLIIQIVNNAYLQNTKGGEESMMDILPEIINIWGKEKTSVKLEISYLMLSFCQNCSIAALKNLLVQKNLLDTLEQIRCQTINIENQTQLFNNIMNIFLQIHKNRQQFEQYGLSYLFSEELELLLHRWLLHQENSQCC